MTIPPKRYHEFDALRGFAMLLGIVLHGLLSFTFLPIWPAQDIHQNSEVYGFVQHAIHGFRMPVFFLISGFFTAMMWRKRGAKGLAVHRAKRILVPLIVGTILVWPLMVVVGYWASVAKEQRADTASAHAEIWAAAKAGHLEGLQQRIEEGTDVNRRDSLGVSPLEWAAMYDHPEAIALLVGQGARVNDRNPDGSTALHAAAFLGRTAAAKQLVELGADPGVRNKRGDTALRAARVDMGIVYLLAGILQVPVDEGVVVSGKRETAAYLQEVGGLSSADGVVVGPGGKQTDRHAGEGVIDKQAGDEGRDQVWGVLWGIYLGATFFPVFHHLWFLYYLLWLVGFFLVAVWVRRWIQLRTPSWMIATPWCLLWLVPLTLLPQLFMTQTFGVDTAPGLIPWPPTLCYYAIFFGFGALCFGRLEFEEVAGRCWLALFVAAVPVLILGVRLFEARQGDPVAHGLVSLCAAAYAWLMAFGLIGVFRRFFARENARIRYLSDSSYWLYLAHLPLVIGLQAWVSNWGVHHFPKLVLICTLTFALLLVTYEYLVRYSFIGTALNGPKTRPPSGSARWAG